MEAPQLQGIYLRDLGQKDGPVGEVRKAGRRHPRLQHRQIVARNPSLPARPAPAAAGFSSFIWARSGSGLRRRLAARVGRSGKRP
jgi:hypothetical protein